MNKQQCISIYRRLIASWSRAQTTTAHLDAFGEVLREAALTRDEIRNSIVHLLSEPLAKDDAKFVEAVFYLLDQVEWPENRLEVMSQLLLNPHHHQHEEMIRLLQYDADPASVPILKEAIALKPKLQYLDYDDYGAYYKKCLWALQDIGTEEAIAVIRDCTQSKDTALKEQAEYRLAKIDGDE